MHSKETSSIYSFLNQFSYFLLYALNLGEELTFSWLLYFDIDQNYKAKDKSHLISWDLFMPRTIKYLIHDFEHKFLLPYFQLFGREHFVIYPLILILINKFLVTIQSLISWNIRSKLII